MIFRCIIIPANIFAQDYTFFLKHEIYEVWEDNPNKKLRCKKAPKDWKTKQIASRVASATVTEILEIIGAFGNQLIATDDLLKRIPALYALLASESHPFYKPRRGDDFVGNLPLFLCYIRFLINTYAIQYSSPRARKALNKTDPKSGNLLAKKFSDPDTWYLDWSPKYIFHNSLENIDENLIGMDWSLYDLVNILVWGKVCTTYDQGKNEFSDPNGRRSTKCRFQPVNPKFFIALVELTHKGASIPKESEMDLVREEMKSESWIHGKYTGISDDEYDFCTDLTFLKSMLGPAAMLARFLYQPVDTALNVFYQNKDALRNHFSYHQLPQEKKEEPVERFIWAEFDKKKVTWKPYYSIKKDKKKKEKETRKSETGKSETKNLKDSPATPGRKKNSGKIHDFIRTKRKAHEHRVLQVPKNVWDEATEGEKINWLTEQESDLSEQMKKVPMKEKWETLMRVASAVAKELNEPSNKRSVGDIPQKKMDTNFTDFAMMVDFMSEQYMGHEYDKETKQFKTIEPASADLGADSKKEDSDSESESSSDDEDEEKKDESDDEQASEQASTEASGED
jgi:hypothetical protein